MKESKTFSTALNKGQLNNLKGFIGEKISAMKGQEIKEYVLDRIGGTWKELHLTPFVEDWDGSPYDDKLLIDKNDTVCLDSPNAEQYIREITKLFDTDRCYFMSKKAIKQLRELPRYLSGNSSNIFLEPGKTIADMELIIYNISSKKVMVKRDFKIVDMTSKQKVSKSIIKKINVIEDVKPILIELKAFTHGVKLTEPQKIALLDSRNSKAFFYFVLNIKFNINIEPEINIIEMQDRLLIRK